MPVNYFIKSTLGQSKLMEDYADAFVIDKILFLCLADGVGGNAQNIASILVVQELKEFLERRLLNNTVENVKYTLLNAFYMLNKILYYIQKINPVYANFTSSLTVIAIWEETKDFLVVHVGNTRGYVIRKGEIYPLTKDHTIAYNLFLEGKISYDEYMFHKDKNTLQRYLGIYDVKFDIASGKFETDDIILLVTNGITDILYPQQIRDIVLSSNSTKEACEWLIKAVEDKEVYDNATIVMSYINF